MNEPRASGRMVGDGESILFGVLCAEKVLSVLQGIALSVLVDLRPLQEKEGCAQ